MKYKQPQEYLLDDFEERIHDFMGYFTSLATKRDLRMIKDRKSFEFVLQKVFSKDSSLRYWVSNVGVGVVDSFYESHYIQSIMEQNKGSETVISPTTEERRTVKQRLTKVRETSFIPVQKEKKRFVKGYIKQKPVRVIKLSVKIKGKEVIRYRDIKTGRWASPIKKRVR